MPYIKRLFFGLLVSFLLFAYMGAMGMVNLGASGISVSSSLPPVFSPGVGSFYPQEYSGDGTNIAQAGTAFATAATGWFYQFSNNGSPANVNVINIPVAVASGDCGGMGCALRVAIYNVTGTTLLFSGLIESGGSPDLNTTGQKTIVNDLGNIVLPTNSFLLVVCSDSTDLRLYTPFETGSYNFQNFAYRQNFTTGDVRNGKITNGCTGLGPTLAPPATTGTLIGDNDFVVAPAFNLANQI